MSNPATSSWVPRCPYCQSRADLWENSSTIHNGFDLGPAWVCARYPRCDSYVGCHPGTTRPLGKLANADLRAMRRLAHAAIDPFWQSDSLREPGLSPQAARVATYAWLARILRIHPDDCHIGLFDDDLCRRVVAASQQKLSGMFGFKDLPL